MDIDKKEFFHKATIHGQKLGELIVYFHVQEIPSYNYFIYMYQCLWDFRKALLFNIRVQQNQQHNHQITSLIVGSPFHCFWGKRKQQNVYVKKLFNKMEGVSASREKGSVKTTTTI